MSEKQFVIGILSDTHGYLNPTIHDIFSDVDFIIHAGDICDDDILIELEAIAPVRAVFGNMDDYSTRHNFPKEIQFTLLDIGFYVTHIPNNGTAPHIETAFQINIFGHTHSANINKIGKRIVLNPGSVSYPRTGRYPTVAKIILTENKEPDCSIIEIKDTK